MADFDKQDFFTDPSVADDNPGYVAHMRGKCPVLRESHHGVFIVTGYDEAMEVLSTRSSSFSSAVAVTGPIPQLPFTPHGDDIREQVRENRPNMPWTEHLATMDGAEHAANRALLQQLLTHSRLKANEDFVSGLVVRLVDGADRQGRLRDHRGLRPCAFDAGHCRSARRARGGARRPHQADRPAADADERRR